jgi:hypothetical protein
MMEDPDNPPPQGPLNVWTRVFTKPGEQTFIEITSHPDAKARTAYIWVFIAGTLAGLIGSLTNFVVTYAELQRQLPQAGGSPGVFGFAGLLSAICLAPVTGLFSVLGLIIGTAIFHATARFFGGQGSFDKLAYAFGAVTVPVTVISALMIPLNAIPFVVFCTLPFLIGLSIYALYLEVAAIKAVYKFSWGEAAGTFFLPTILIGLLCAVIVVLGLRMIGPEINEIFRQLQQGIP